MVGDLHCHTRMSDGSAGIEEIIMMAKRLRIDVIAITDHDTMAGATRAVLLGDRYGVKVIHGVELSAYDYQRKRKVHLLCYRCQKPDRLEGLCRRTSDNRKQAAVEMIKKIMPLYPVTPDMVVKCASGSTNIYKQHIMQALMEAGYTTTIYGDLYNKLFDMETGCCYSDPEYPDVFEVLKLIHESGGIAILAHPTVYNSMDLLPDLIENGLDGVEVCHPRNAAEDVGKLKELAVLHKLLTTGGTDFHGMYSAKAFPLGSYVTAGAALDAFLSYSVKNRRSK